MNIYWTEATFLEYPCIHFLTNHIKMYLICLFVHLSVCIALCVLNYRALMIKLNIILQKHIIGDIE